MFNKRKTLSAAIHLACTGVVATGIALSGMASAEEAVKLEKEQVTGSHIKRTDIEGPSPLLVIDRADIEATGASTVSQVLRQLTINSGPSFDEKFTNSFAPGSAGISFRGLGQDATLVLLNGRRVSNYGFAQNINDAFVDLNSIPLGAVERIEILKDGASAIYGSDAIAGVVNIILRKDYEGTEIGFGYGGTDKGDGQETSVHLLSGVSGSAGNLTLNIDYFDRNAIDLKDRDFSKFADHTGQVKNDGYNFTSSTFPVANVRAADDLEWLSFNGRYDYNPWITMIPETERFGGLVTYNKDITNDIELYAEASYNHVETNAQSAPTPLFGDLPPNKTNIGPILASNPYNTYGEDVYVRWRMEEFGPRKSHIETDATRFLAGLRGTFENGWDWDGAAIYSRSKTVDSGSNFVNSLALINAIDAGLINPFGTTANDPDVVNSIKATTSRTGISELKSVDFTVSGDVIELDAGSLGVAVGMEYREESLEDSPDALSANEQIIGSGGAKAEGDRDLFSAYVEFNVPVFDGLELQVAGRFEEYSDFGTTTNPKLAARYQPLDWMTFRASWGTGFRAPSLAEIYSGGAVSYPFLYDEKRCEASGGATDCGVKQYRTTSQGNPDLDPEESESYNIGFVMEPLEDLTIGIDYWNYQHEDIIDADPQYILDHEDAFPGLIIRSAPAFPGDPGEIQTVNAQFVNLAEQETNGIDFDIAYQYDAGEWGEFRPELVMTWINSFKRKAAPGESFEELIGTYGYPELRAQLRLGWQLNDYRVNVTGFYIDSYDQYYTNWNDAQKQVDSMWTWDLQFAYDGFQDVELIIGAENLFDEEPPFSNSETEGYDFSTHDPRGRFIYGRVNWRF